MLVNERRVHDHPFAGVTVGRHAQRPNCRHCQLHASVNATHTSGGRLPECIMELDDVRMAQPSQNADLAKDDPGILQIAIHI